MTSQDFWTQLEEEESLQTQPQTTSTSTSESADFWEELEKQDIQDEKKAKKKIRNSLGNIYDEIVNAISNPKKIAQSVADVGKQFVLGGLEGSGSVINEMLGQSGMTPGEEARWSGEFEALQPDNPWIGWYDDSDILPSATALRKGEMLDLLERQGIDTERKDDVVSNVARNYGENLASGAKIGPAGLAGSSIMAVAKETARQAGFGETGQLIAELLSTLKNPVKMVQRGVTSSTAAINDTLKELRRLGWSEDAITILKNKLEPRNVLKKITSEGAKAKEQFQKVYNEAKDTFNAIKEKGLQGGTASELQEWGNSLYDNIKKTWGNLTVENTDNLIKSIDSEIKTLKSYPDTKDRYMLIEFLKGEKNKLKKGKTPGTIDYFYDLHKQLNSKMNVSDDLIRKSGENLKRSVKDTIGRRSKNASIALEKTDETYRGLQNAIRSDEVLNKAMTNGELNPKKLKSVLSNEKNRKTLEKTFSADQIKKMEQIVDVSEAVKELPKELGKSLFKSKNGAFVYAVTSGVVGQNYGKVYDVMIGLGGLTASVLGKNAITQRMLTDPKWQNLTLKLLDAVKNNSSKAIPPLVRSMQRHFNENYTEQTK